MKPLVLNAVTPACGRLASPVNAANHPGWSGSGGVKQQFK
jgi:hypothetical protein